MNKQQRETAHGKFCDDLDEVLDEIREELIEKNRKYGDSALSPARTFSKASVIEQINVRLDDKLARKISDQSDEDEDIDRDILGYLLLKRIAIKRGTPGPKTESAQGKLTPIKKPCPPGAVQDSAGNWWYP